MVKQIITNTKAVESMLFIWSSLKDKQKIADQFYIQLAASPEMQAAYDEEFDENSFRKVLSAISNREVMSDATAKEKRFWNNNMWMTEDLGFTEMMLEPVKTLHLGDRLAELPAEIPYETLEVIFYPGTTELCTLRKEQLFINFFKIHVDMFDPEAEPSLDGKSIADFVIQELSKAV